jgi:hypothetical protein
VALEDLHGLEMIAFDADLEIRHEIDRALAAKGVEVRVAMEFDNTETIKRAVEIDAGVSLLPEPTVDREVKAGALVARPLAGVNLTRPIGIIQRRGKDLGKTATRFMQLLIKLPPLSREIAEHDEPGSEASSPSRAAAVEPAADGSSFTDDLVPPAAGPATKSPENAARVAS